MAKRRTASAEIGGGLISEISLSAYAQSSMKDYAEEVNLSRSVPDLIDGLKPVQRRILWSAFGMTGKGFRKTARIVGDCFAAGTLVTLATGDKVNIEDVRVGDQVLTDTGAEDVTRTFVRESCELIELTLGDITIQATPDQIFYCLDAKGREVERTASTLQVGDRVKTA